MPTATGYAGHAAPGASVTLDASNIETRDVTRLGLVVAGADGSWSIDLPPLAPGRYKVVARASPPVVPDGRPVHMVPTAWMPPLVIRPKAR